MLIIFPHRRFSVLKGKFDQIIKLNALINMKLIIQNSDE